MNSKESKSKEQQEQFNTSVIKRNITIFLYYNGDYAMKYENLTRLKADELLLKWNSTAYPGWIAKEQ